ncbi:PAS domain S-box protein [Paucibacter sediminis]|uniref:histidine kinase n=1 Tax=Paucibacter sediminis TaxID=3019553 RepID=A0AA95NEN7_9BURK|nr:PAS domain S-box protein [Paucibacter sp. S2-9]WIT10889.1 PAS domain S-box protein [Paucibacter sp. S2-9]
MIPPHPPPAAPRRPWALLVWYWPALLSVLVGALIVAGLLRLHLQTDRAAARGQLEAQLTLLRARIEATAQSTFSPTLGLEAMIQLDGDISEERFERLTSRAVKLVPQLRSVVAAPDDVARHVFPRAGNERVFGLVYRSIPAQWAQVQAARAQRGPLIVAPVVLVQGGMGIIQRTPVFLRDAAAPDGQRYWGVVSVVADLERFMQVAGLERQAGLALEIVDEREGRQAARHIWGETRLAEAGAVRQVAQLPGGLWTLLALPQGGWESGLAWQSADVMASLIGAALVTALLALLGRQRHVLSQRNEALAHEIETGRQASQQLQESQARFRSLAALASDWVWEQDAELRFTYISRTAEEASNVHSSSVLGHRRWESPAIAPGVDWEAHKAQLARHEPFRDLEYSQYTEDGTLRHVSVSGTPIFDADGVFRGYRGTGRNITPAKQAEAALRQSQADLMQARDRLQALLDAAIEVAIIATDLQGRMMLFNRGAERMLDYREEDMLGKSPALLHLPAEVEARGLALSAELGRPIQGFETFVALAQRDGIETREWTYLRRDGQALAVSLSVTHVRDRHGTPLGYLGVARDISAQRQAERQSHELHAELESRVSRRTAELREALAHLHRAQDELLRSEKLAALGSLVAGVAHELNTPLGNCLTTASTLDERTRETRQAFVEGHMRRSSLASYLDDAGAATAILLRGLGTANELVTHFKQLSVDQTSVQRRQYRLDAVVDDVLSLMRARWKTTPYRIRTDIPPELELDGYPGPLSQVLSNLMLNALLHAFEGRDSGELSISARALDAQQFELVVADDGLGMSEEVRRRAFDPFFTTKMGRGGTGLGLNIVYNIITDILGGHVELHSEPGRGSRFVFRLPRVAPELKGH